MELVGVKPFWLIDDSERRLHICLAQWWYEGEWFDPKNDPYLEHFLSGFCAFSDLDEHRDKNSIDFIYWMHEMLDVGVEFERRTQSVRAFQRDLSGSKKR
jgi:hypothetical protein